MKQICQAQQVPSLLPTTSLSICSRCVHIAQQKYHGYNNNEKRSHLVMMISINCNNTKKNYAMKVRVACHLSELNASNDNKVDDNAKYELHASQAFKFFFLSLSISLLTYQLYSIIFCPTTTTWYAASLAQT